MTRFRLPEVAMTDEHARLRAEVREFLRDELRSGGFTPSSDSWLCSWDAGFTKRVAERGWIGMTIPVEYGGHGRSALERYVVIEELLAAGAPLTAHWISDRQIAPSILANGSEEQKHRYLPAIAAGEALFCLGMSEPQAGSDLAAVAMRARRTDAGWVLNGRKMWTSGAHHSTAMLLIARTSTVEGSRHAGLSQFICDMPHPGVVVSPIRLMSGAHHFNEVLFDDAVLPHTALLGQEGDGWRQVTAELSYERSGPERYLSAMPLLAYVVAHRDELPDDGALDDTIGDLLARAWTLRRLSLGVAGALARGEQPGAVAAMVKDLGTTFEQDLVDRLSHCIDAARLPAESPLRPLLAHALVQSPGFTLRGGANEILRGIVARELGLR